jgi:phage shock protein PspC (stress-responsive transcriptional regulator)
MEKRLTRSTDNRMIAGICGGLGEYFRVDPVIVRVIFVLLAFADAIGIVAYLILWIIVPLREKAELPPKDAVKEGIQDIRDQAERFSKEVHSGSARERSLWLGIILIVVGVIFILSNTGNLRLFGYLRFWPLILIIAGIVLLVNRFMRQEAK